MYIALYDKNCMLCRKTKHLFENLDKNHRVEWRAFQHTNDFSMLNQINLQTELHVITPTKDVLKGFYAVRRIGLLFPATKLLSIFSYLPYASSIGVPVYKIIAKNRHRFFKVIGESNCRIQ